MKRDVSIRSDGGPITAGVKIIDHIGVTALDLWRDEDGNGRPDQFWRRAKEPNINENTLVEVGLAGDLLGKVLQWIWMPSQPPSSTDDWRVTLHIEQGGETIAGFPLALTGGYPSGKKYGLFETWVRFTEAK